MVSHTPINVFMDMTVAMFYEFYHAIHNVVKRQNEQKRKNDGK